MKETLKKSFPNLYDNYLYYKYKLMDKKKMEYYSKLSVENYSDELKRIYKNNMGFDLNLDNPLRFSEKIQWRKLNELTPQMSSLSDKYMARKWVSEKIGEEYLIPLIGVWDSFDSIDFDLLPNSFVLKTNNASGTNAIVQNKSEMNVKRLKRQFEYWLVRPFGLLSGLEFQYMAIEPKIIAEQNLLQNGVKDLPDYKFFCFDGKIYCSYTCVDFVLDHSKGRLGFFDRDYKKMNVYRDSGEYLPLYEELEKPINYQQMVDIVEKLAEGFSHVRVDLYNLDGKIYFGEMTFTTHSGYCKFVPDEFDFTLGAQWKLPLKK